MQLSNVYIEILEVAEPEKIPPHGARSFSFGAFNRDFLAQREGLSMLILNSRDAVADSRAFQTSGIGDFEIFDFAREGEKPDGTVIKLAFSLAFAADPASPNVRFAVCQHHFPENFWNPAFQHHANGGKAVLGATLVAIRPTSYHMFLKAFTGIGDLHSSSVGIRALTPNGEVEIMAPVAFRDQYGIAVQTAGEGMTLNAMRFEVADVTQVEALLRRNGVACQRHAGRLVVSPDVAHGASLIFEPTAVRLHDLHEVARHGVAG